MTVPRPNANPGPLNDHVRKGRVFQPPLAATGVLEVGDWFRDDLPDLIWPALVLAERGTTDVVRFVRWQQDVQNDLSGTIEPQVLADCLDGRLTSLDRLAATDVRAQSIVGRRAHQRGLLTEPVVRALSSYPLCPAGWLLGLDLQPPDQASIDLIARALREAIADGHREAVIKCLPIWSNVQAGTFRSSAATIELLRQYPGDLSTRPKADTAIRAMWGAHRGMLIHQDADHFLQAITWAKVFWGVNSTTTRCVRQRDRDSHDGNSDPNADSSPDGETSAPAEVPVNGAHLRQLAMDLLSSYVEALERAPASLHDHERHEVHAGLVARAGRELITALGAPDLWCMEHGSHIIRVLVEVRIYLQWMATQDATIYRSFQEYGAGKAKLYARIMDELPAEARQPEFEEAIKDVERLSHNGPLDYRTVDTRDSFAEGKSIRAMASECGLLDFYRQAYSMASGVARSEWWSVEAHAMERCLNVMHGGHLIPSLSLSAGGNVDLAKSWVDQLYALIRQSLNILGTDAVAVAAAFSWLEDDDASEQESPEH